MKTKRYTLPAMLVSLVLVVGAVVVFAASDTGATDGTQHGETVGGHGVQEVEGEVNSETNGVQEIFSGGQINFDTAAPSEHTNIDLDALTITDETKEEMPVVPGSDVKEVMVEDQINFDTGVHLDVVGE